MTNSINLPSPTLSMKDSHATAVQVAIRVRPLTEGDQEHSRFSHSSDSKVIKTSANTVTIIPQQKSFHFDHVFDSESTQDQVYTGVVSNLVDRFLDGYNVTILAYGQTSSGKTHTIMGSAGSDQEGIIPLAMSAFFERLRYTGSSPLSPTSSQKFPPTSTSAAMDSRYPPSPLSPCSSSPRSSVSTTTLRPISTIMTNNSYGSNNDSNPSRRDSAPALLWKSFDKSPRNSVRISFVEIYNEELVDLLNSSPLNERPPTAIREDTKGQIHWTGVKEVLVNKPAEVLRCLKMGTEARTTGSTDMNSKSSRSHAIFTVTLKQEKWVPTALSSSKSSDTSQRRETPLSLVSSVSSIVGVNGRPPSLKIRTRMGQTNQQQQYVSGKSDVDGDWVVVHSKFHFVDLAGSERLKRTSAEGDRRKEGIHINAGLLALGNVISALASDSSSSSITVNNRKTTHVPYRDSKLTRMLQDSLGGNAVTLMIACISPAERNLAETINTIKYAHRARHIKNKAERNETEDWMANDNPEWLRTLICQLKSDIKIMKSELLHRGRPTNTDIDTQLQQKLWECEQSAQMASQRQSGELEKLKMDIKSLIQVEIKQDQLIHILEQKLVGMAQVVTYLQRQLDLQDKYIMQLRNDTRPKIQQEKSTQSDLEDTLFGMADGDMEGTKLNMILEWMDKLKAQHENGKMESSVSSDQLQRLYNFWGTNDPTEKSMARELGDIKDNKMNRQMIQQNLERPMIVEIESQKSAALEKRLIELDQTLAQTMKDRDDLTHAMDDKQKELQVAQRLIEKQTTELEQVQRQVSDTMVLLGQERKLSEVKDTSHLVVDLEDRIQILQRARELDQQEHDSQLDSVMDDLQKSQEAYEQQSHMVVSLKQTIQNMQQRLDKTPTAALSNQHQQMDESLWNNNQLRPSNSNSSKWIEENPSTKPLKLRPSSSTPYPIASASQAWSSNRNISTIENHLNLATPTFKQNHDDAHQTAVTVETKEQLQMFNDKKVQLMMKILDMETQLRTQRSQFNADMDILESDSFVFGGSSNCMDKGRKKLVPHPPRKLRSATSQPLIASNHGHRVSLTSPPSTSHHVSPPPPPPPLAQDILRHELASTDDNVTKLQQHARSKRTSSSSATTFLSTGTQTSSNVSGSSIISNTPQRTSSIHTAISTVSGSDIIINNNITNNEQLSSSLQTTAEQYNKMFHALQCQAQVSESNIHAHQDVIHKLERQLSRSETSVRDTKKQLEVLHKEKQAYTLEIKNLRSQLTLMMTQQKTYLDESGERRKHLEIALEQERRLKEMAEKARLILENRMEVLMTKKTKFMCF